ncbi:hypothetical protein JRQ81_004290 [Phrynocephalus forsythii]|uniref:Olfactory receptor n=1 Tax=Phrynocephalus forsythii TaxID=171643 RepID=A0A9Q0XEZ5_9SAUR|nr:hypothetical protein JRQ81_004290 [Phrynocephalus forsythii]
MELNNSSIVHEFILLGFGVEPHRRFLLLIFFTTLYVLTLAENLTIIIVVCLDARLPQIPMYILLSNFSWLEMCYVTTTVPCMLFDLTSPRGTISFHACFIQFYLFFSLGTTECFFLSTMALDRYLAICHPLHYPQLMSTNTCYALVAACWVVGFLWFPIRVLLISKLSFCGPNVIDHFLCDLGPILSLACPPLGNVASICQTFINVLIVGNFSFIALSYSIVILKLTKQPTKGSHRKAFSTISLHITVVVLFFGSASAMYAVPNGKWRSEVNKAVTLFYTAVTPFVNPLIYCLRNQQVKEALIRLLKRKEIWWRRKEET